MFSFLYKKLVICKGFVLVSCLSFSLFFFLSCPPLQAGWRDILLSPVIPIDYVKKIGKFRMEIPQKNMIRIQGYKDDEKSH